MGGYRDKRRIQGDLYTQALCNSTGETEYVIINIYPENICLRFQLNMVEHMTIFAQSFQKLTETTVLFVFSATLCGMWNLSSSTRN